MDVLAAKACELGDAQAGLHGQEQQGVVAATDPGRAVGALQKRFDLWPFEIGDQCGVEPLWRDREHPLDQFGVLRGLQ